MKERRPDAKMLIFLGRTPLRIHKGLCRQLLLKQPLWENRKEEEGRTADFKIFLICSRRISALKPILKEIFPSRKFYYKFFFSSQVKRLLLPTVCLVTWTTSHLSIWDKLHMICIVYVCIPIQQSLLPYASLLLVGYRCMFNRETFGPVVGLSS